MRWSVRNGARQSKATASIPYLGAAAVVRAISSSSSGGLARQEAVSVADLEDEPLILPRRDTPAGRFRSVVEHLCAQAGFAPRVAYELDDLPAAQAFVAAGIAVVPMHGLTLATVPAGAVTRPLAGRPAGSRAVEALAPADGRTPVVDDLLDRLVSAARAHA